MAYNRKVKAFNSAPNPNGHKVWKKFPRTSMANQFFMKVLRATCDILAEVEGEVRALYE